MEGRKTTVSSTFLIRFRFQGYCRELNIAIFSMKSSFKYNIFTLKIVLKLRNMWWNILFCSIFNIFLISPLLKCFRTVFVTRIKNTWYWINSGLVAVNLKNKLVWGGGGRGEGWKLEKGDGGIYKKHARLTIEEHIRTEELWFSHNIFAT